MNALPLRLPTTTKKLKIVLGGMFLFFSRWIQNAKLLHTA
jgi:hypothetical protein